LELSEATVSEEITDERRSEHPSFGAGTAEPFKREPSDQRGDERGEDVGFLGEAEGGDHACRHASRDDKPEA
jgi:hypothetical protein